MELCDGAGKTGGYGIYKLLRVVVGGVSVNFFRAVLFHNSPFMHDGHLIGNKFDDG